MARTGRNPVIGSKNMTAERPVISRAMRVSDILALVPEAEPLVAEYGLYCFSCDAREFETLEDGCRSHGFADEDIDDLVGDLNTLLAERPERPQTLTVTKDAAGRLGEILAAEDKTDWILVVSVDAGGSFCLEFAETFPEEHLPFGNEEVPAVRLAASPSTLSRIGGATIDLRDGRFKLDLPEDAAKKGGCACGGGSCGCGRE
jgi:hybrid cluster-associated redox disulfide protein